MMKRLSIFVLAVAASAILGSGAAWSGIIVTVGKTSATSSDTRSTGDDDDPRSTRPIGGDEAGDVRGDAIDGRGWGDPRAVPPGCRPLGGGLVYCDDERAAKRAARGVGSGPGAGAGGGVGADDPSAESIETLGCASGGAAPGLGFALLALLGLGFIRRFGRSRQREIACGEG